MITSQISILSKPEGVGRIPAPTFAYLRARLKHRIYNIIIKEFKKSGLNQADLARRLDKEPAQLSRILSGPGNLTLDTISDYLFAICGKELTPMSDAIVDADVGRPFVSAKRGAAPPVGSVLPTTNARNIEPFRHQKSVVNIPGPRAAA